MGERGALLVLLVRCLRLRAGVGALALGARPVLHDLRARVVVRLGAERFLRGKGRGREEVELRRGRPLPPAADVKSSVALLSWQGFSCVSCTDFSRLAGTRGSLARAAECSEIPEPAGFLLRSADTVSERRVGGPDEPSRHDIAAER